MQFNKVFIGERLPFVDSFPVEHICVYTYTRFVPDKIFFILLSLVRGNSSQNEKCNSALEVTFSMPPHTVDAGETISKVVREHYNNQIK